MTNPSLGAEQQPERQKKTEEIERRKQNYGPGQAPENLSKTRHLEDWKHKTVQRDEDRDKTDRIEKLKNKP